MSFVDLALKFGSLGDTPTDTEEDRLQHRLVVFMGVLMSGGGLLWGSIAAYYDLALPAIVPFGYVVLTAINLSFFRATKRFHQVRFFQVLISLLLPFLFQWSLGGFESSGVMLMWGMLALAGSLTFTETKSALGWLALFTVFTIVSGVIDSYVFEAYSNRPSSGVRTVFYTINMSVITSIVFGLMIYLQSERERANLKLVQAKEDISKMNAHLEDEVGARTTELRSALGQSEAILNNMADGLVAISFDGIINVANPVFGELLMQGADLSGQEARKVLPVQLSQLAEDCCKHDVVKRLEMAMPGEKTGTAIASPIHGAGGRCEGVVVILRDITLEKEIDRMKTDFIATVSHELRTPLTSVLGFAKLTKNKLETQILKHIPEDDKRGVRAKKQVQGNIDIIISEGERLTNLINDVLDISKMEAGHMEWEMDMLDPTGLVQRAREAASGLFTDDAVTLEVELEEALPTIRGDHDRLLQVLLNLLSNAFKFTDSGTVTMRAKTTMEGVEFSVTDTGDGIEASDLGTVFEKFRQVGDTLTNKPKGTGLGLPICRQIISSHGGRIWAMSTKGEGSTFSFFVPSDFSAVEESRPTMESIVERIDRHVQFTQNPEDLNILVVDDDPSLREMLRQQLSGRGFNVRLAENGYSAIQAVREQVPDLVLLDVMMPDITGFDVAAVLKSDPKTRSVPIIILSIIQDRERGYRLGIESYLTKPTASEDLIDEIERVLRESRAKQNLLVVDPDPLLDYRRLQSRGYVIVGTCRSNECLREAKRLMPDVIIFGQKAEESKDLVQELRAVRGLERTHVLSLLDMQTQDDSPKRPKLPVLKS